MPMFLPMCAGHLAANQVSSPMLQGIQGAGYLTLIKRHVKSALVEQGAARCGLESASGAQEIGSSLFKAIVVPRRHMTI